MSTDDCQNRPAQTATADLVAAAAAQLVEHVDERGQVIQVVTRAEMRARALRHRSVYVAVLDHDDQLLVHKRADWKDVFPGAWDLAFGGVCDVGEDWEPSAHRELMEEAGVRGELIDHGPVFFEAPGVALVGRFFVCRHEGPFTFNDGEVTDTQWVPLQDLADFVNNHQVPPDSKLVVTSLARGLGTDDRQNE
ncbi:MAG: isopentenyldiphosphate isomerase [Paracrocinitomix sp.]|jgi:isopentenyldiphosphate isomerase